MSGLNQVLEETVVARAGTGLRGGAAAPGDRGGTTQSLGIRDPGGYLVRVEVRPESEKPGNEEFAEIELVVK